MSKKIKDVHTSHCCEIHGCKYGDKDCTVMAGMPQEGPCEQCGLELEGYYGPEDQRIASRRWPNDFRAKDVAETSKVGYMCKPTFDHEIGETNVEIYPNLESMPDHPGCGIVKVEINVIKVIREDNFEAELKNDRPIQK